MHKEEVNTQRIMDNVSRQKKGYWHGIVQGIAWLVFIIVCYFSVVLVLDYQFQIYNILLVDSLFLAVTIAITFSHAYNQKVRLNAPPIWNQAERQKALWVHANFCWQTVSIWMTISPLYCTCIAIYLSGNNRNPEDVLIHSILSLVISLGVYALRPSNRAAAYSRAYALVNDALMKYELNPKKGKKLLAKAMDEGAAIIVKAVNDTQI